MSTSTIGVYAKLLTDRLGIGVTLNAGTGAITLVTGVEVCRVTADPNGNTTANSGSVALQQSNATSTLWINTSVGSGTTWLAVGGAAVTNFLNNVVETFGTATPLQVQQVYVSASNRFDLRGVAVSQAGAQAGVAIRVATGTDEITGAGVGGASGAIEILSGATNANNVAATAGASGAISIATGASTLTLGTSGNSGAVSVSTGNSTSGNSGNITLQTGTAGGVRGTVVINSAVIDYSTQGMQALVFENNATAYSMGATGALNMLVLDTRNGIEQVVVNAPKGIGLPNDIPMILGTAANDVFTLSYLTASTSGALAGASITAGGATQATRGLGIVTGTRVLTDAAGSPASGNISLTSGESNVNFAGGGATGGNSGTLVIGSGGTDIVAGVNTGGNSGGVTILSGNCQSTGAGTSGASGNVTIQSGSSTDGNSGNVILTTGAAGGTRGQVNATARLTTTDGVTAGTARIVGGQANENPAASANVANVLAAFSTGTYAMPANTLKHNTVIRFEAIVGVTAVSGAGATSQVKVFLNGVAGTLVFDTTVLNQAAGTLANSYFILTGRLACRTSGGGGTMVGVMAYTLGAVNAVAGTTSSDIAGSVAGTYTVAVNTGIANTLDIGAVTDAAGTTLVLEDFHVYMEA